MSLRCILYYNFDVFIFLNDNLTVSAHHPCCLIEQISVVYTLLHIGVSLQDTPLHFSIIRRDNSEFYHYLVLSVIKRMSMYNVHVVKYYRPTSSS